MTEYSINDVVELPRHLAKAISSVAQRRGVAPQVVAKVVGIYDAESSPLGYASLVVQMKGGYNHGSNLGEPFLVRESEVKRLRLHGNCDTCTCTIPEPESENMEEIDEDEEEELEPPRRYAKKAISPLD